MHPVLLLGALGIGAYFLSKKTSTAQMPLNLGLPNPNPPSSPGSPPGGLNIKSFPAGSYIVSTQTDPLNLRSDPSTNNPPIGELQKGSIVVTDGSVNNGFTGVLDENGSQVGFAAIMYLTSSDTTVSVKGMPMVASNVALQTQQCLNKIGCRPSIPLTGYWDNATMQCLADFQVQHGLQPTGQADPYTRQILQHYCS